MGPTTPNGWALKNPSGVANSAASPTMLFRNSGRSSDHPGEAATYLWIEQRDVQTYREESDTYEQCRVSDVAQRL